MPLTMQCFYSTHRVTKAQLFTWEMPPFHLFICSNNSFRTYCSASIIFSYLKIRSSEPNSFEGLHSLFLGKRTCILSRLQWAVLVAWKQCQIVRAVKRDSHLIAFLFLLDSLVIILLSQHVKIKQYLSYSCPKKFLFLRPFLFISFF